MPSTTAVRITDAALEVLGTGGIHALSHARVDVTAGLPPGSTSNHFRTRAALVAAAVDRLRELDAANYRLLIEAGPPTSLAGLIQPFAAFVEDATGPSRTRTVARYVIYVQGVVEPALLELLNADRTLLVTWTAAALTSLNVADAEAVASTVLATVEGLILHRLTNFVTIPPHPEIARVIGALCRGAVPPLPLKRDSARRSRGCPDRLSTRVAGARGTPSYLVAAHAGPVANFSVAHGAGRKMSRADALVRGRAKHTVEELRRTPLGSLVVCGDRQVLFEEAPTAYKRIEQVVGDLVGHGLATSVVTTVPVVTYKAADLAAPREHRDNRRGRGGRERG